MGHSGSYGGQESGGVHLKDERYVYCLVEDGWNTVEVTDKEVMTVVTG